MRAHHAASVKLNGEGTQPQPADPELRFVPPPGVLQRAATAPSALQPCSWRDRRSRRRRGRGRLRVRQLNSWGSSCARGL